MPEFPLHKLQFLAPRDSGHPIFYTHHEDAGHFPALLGFVHATTIELFWNDMLFKVKANPQTKARVDMYMSMEQAHELGRWLRHSSMGTSSIAMRSTGVDPHAAAIGSMALPAIQWTVRGKHAGIGAHFGTGTTFAAAGDGSFFVDAESPHETHIKMRDTEIHIGIPLTEPLGSHDPNKARYVDVPDHELQRGRQERNPLPKTIGSFGWHLEKGHAAGLGTLLVKGAP